MKVGSKGCRGSSRGGSALPRSSVARGFTRGASPGTLTFTLRPSLVVSSGGCGSSGSPGIGVMARGYSARARSCRFRLTGAVREQVAFVRPLLHVCGRCPSRAGSRSRVDLGTWTREGRLGAASDGGLVAPKAKAHRAALTSDPRVRSSYARNALAPHRARRCCRIAVLATPAFARADAVTD